MKISNNQMSKPLSKIINELPVLTMDKLRPNEGAYMTSANKRRRRGYYKGYGEGGRNCAKNPFPIGHEDQKVPEFLKVPREPYYKAYVNQKEYVPLSLMMLQRFIDLNYFNTNRLIDIVTLCNTKRFFIDSTYNQYGVHLTSDGIDKFSAKVDIEVQKASEEVIAAVEKNGGTITTKYYDHYSVKYATDIVKHFKMAKPVPLVRFPADDCYEYYTDAKNRGYLASDEDIAQSRFLLSQKYGYENVEKPYKAQIKPKNFLFVNLKPGWIVDMTEKCILKPKDKDYLDFYDYNCV